MSEEIWSETDGVVVLVRHAEAVPKQIDPDRPLSDRGIRRAERTAAWLAGLAPPLGSIHHSGKARARMTAEILARRLGFEDEVRAIDGLAPNDDVEAVAGALESGRESVLLSSHLPFVERLTSRLLTGETDRLPLFFADGAAAVLGRVGGRFLLVAFATPDTVAG